MASLDSLNKLELDLYNLGSGIEADVSFYKKSKRIALGTKEPHDSYDGPETMSDNDFYWWDINPKRVLNWVIISRAGTHKTWFLKRIMTYLHHHNYKIVGFDAKGNSLVSGKYMGRNLRFHPQEVPTKLPVEGYLPSFAASQKYGPRSLSSDTIFKFDNHFTLDFKDIVTLDEWKTLMGATDTGANEIVDLLQSKNFTSIGGIIRAVNSKKMNPATRMSIINRLKTFMHYEVFNVKSQKITENRGIRNSWLDLRKIWRKKVIPAVSFYMCDPRYMKIVVNNILNQQWLINREAKDDKKLNILNVFDDSQFYFNRDDSNVASVNATATIDLGRTNLFNGIYVVQNPSQFHYPIIDGCKDKFISDLDDPGELARVYGRDVVDMVKQLDRKSDPSKYNYAWIHIPAAKRYSTIFYPCGSPVYHHLGG